MIVVLGDAMVDVDQYACCTRFSQEVPSVPVHSVYDERRTPGGAAGVQAAVEARGTPCRLICGDSSVKTRVWVGGRVVARVDREAGKPQLDLIRSTLREIVPQARVLLVADYAKGVCDGDTVALAIGLALHYGIEVLVDPGPGVPWSLYYDATCIKCNGAEYRNEYRPPHLIITHGEKGLTHTEGNKVRKYPCHPRAGSAIGCGDVVLATLGVARAAGVPWREACAWAVQEGADHVR